MLPDEPVKVAPPKIKGISTLRIGMAKGSTMLDTIIIRSNRP
jgi:hypothetical protein